MSSESKSDENNKEVGKLEWEKKLKQIKISKTDMNKLIMNYLCMEGYKDAALKFQQETTLPQSKPKDLIFEEF
jgi:glucose-induced degradation protein 8